MFAYERTLEAQRLLVLCNFTKEEQVLDIPEEVRYPDGKVLISNYGRKETDDIQVLRPYEAVVVWKG